MKTETKNETDIASDAAQSTRELPLPPGGGSWTFDPVDWKWIPNTPMPATAEQLNQE